MSNNITRPRYLNCSTQWSSDSPYAVKVRSSARALLAAQRRQNLVAAEGARALERTFNAYGELELHRVEQFKYLGRVLSFDDNDTSAISRNIKRVRQVWGRISKVIAKDSVPVPVAGMFYQAVIAAVLLYGSETWVTPQTNYARWRGFMWRRRAVLLGCG